MLIIQYVGFRDKEGVFDLTKSMLLDIVETLLRRYICGSRLIVDIGTGSGGSVKLLLNACSFLGMIVGVDLDCTRLRRAKNNLGSKGRVELVCADASCIPIVSSTVEAVTMVMTLHEVDERRVDVVLEEVHRILDPGGILFFIDKVLFKPKNPAEELVILTENAYHKAVEYH